MAELILLWMIAFIVMSLFNLFIEIENQKDFFLGTIIVIIMYSYAAFAYPALPDYIFIAPFSLEDRKNIIKRFFVISMLMNFLCLSIMYAALNFIEFILYGNSQTLYSYLLQEIILFGIVYLFSYLKYLRSYSAACELGVIAVSTIWEGILAGIMEMNGEFMLKEIVLIFAVVNAITICLVVYYYVRHFKAMVDYYADYEVSHCQK